MTASSPETTKARDIKTLIRQFFAAINASDTKALQSHFLPSANLTIIRQDPPAAPSSPPPDADNKANVVLRTSIETFVRMIDEAERRRKERGDQGPKLHEQPDLEATDVRVNAGFASAWSPFEVTFDGELHHYGVIVYCLVQREGEWRIESVTQDYRRTPGWDEDPSEW